VKIVKIVFCEAKINMMKVASTIYANIIEEYSLEEKNSNKWSS